jgi:accessory gene regulator B
MSYLGFSRKWADSLAATHQLSEEKHAELTYAIEILTLNTVEVILALFLGWALGVFLTTFACLLTIAAFRHNAGGGHSESPWRCMAATVIIFPLLALAGVQISAWQPVYREIIALVAVILGFALILKYAPVDDPKAPIVSPLRRKRLKKYALIIMAILAAVIIGLRFGAGAEAAQIRMGLALSVLWVSFNLTPLGHRLWCFIDGIGKKQGERRCTE